MEYLYIIIALAIAGVMAVVSYLVGRRSSSSVVSLARCQELEEQLARSEQRVEQMRQENVSLRSERDVEHARRIGLEEQMAELKVESKQNLETQIASLNELHDKQLAQLREEQQRQMEELKLLNKQQVEAQLSLIREQMRTTSETVLKARQEELGERNIEQVSKIVDPLNQSLKQMQEALQNSNKEHTETMTRLDATIQANMQNSRDLGETAERLTRALIGEVKVQGNFGELKLRQLLEDLGLKDGEQYSTQQTLKDKFGTRIKDDEEKGLIPDFILHFPNNRDVIVDSKVNLKAYEAYINRDTGINTIEESEEKSRLCREHIAAVRRQVDLLAKKDYTKYLDTDYTRLNFVIMYMHNEGALNLALMNDSSLWKYGYDKGVLILGPQTMYMNLRILELMWTQSRQLRYQKEIIKTAEEIIERTQIFAKRFNDVETCLKKTVDAIGEVKKSTANEKKSIITSARKLIGFGIKESKNHVKITSVFAEEETPQMIGELAEESESMQQMSSILGEDDEVIEKKYRN